MNDQTLQQVSLNGSPETIGVMVVGSSAVVGAKVKAALTGNPGITLQAEVPDGVTAVTQLRRQKADVVVLDIGVGERESLTVIKRVLNVSPGTRVVMAGTLSFANVKTSMLGLMRGAVEFVTTPADFTQKTSEAEFRTEMTRLIRGLGRADHEAAARLAVAGAVPSAGRVAPPRPPIRLRDPGPGPAEVIVIGSSTGGPAALVELVPALVKSLNLPILITQHMPANFTAQLAATLGRKSDRPGAEGKDGEPVLPGHIYVAPGGRHLALERRAGTVVIALTDDPPLNYCRPSVEPLFDSAATVYGAKALAIMLTGMGHDGIGGARKLIDANATLVAQDEESSVVWGMPGAVAEAGLCCAVLPLDKLAAEVVRLATRRR